MLIFSQRLKWLREKRGLTQAEMAEKLNMSQPGYSKIESGRSEPNLETLVKLPKILGEDLNFIVGLDDYTFEAKQASDELHNVNQKLHSILGNIDFVINNYDEDHKELFDARKDILEQQLLELKIDQSKLQKKLDNYLSNIPQKKDQ
ncbi:helix-turn-helix transcriptional regulator [Fodinisporobacter ferrooxydans]|uniref:Helix-turn-helix transcriptional regulator n=1 Tax=Fodinisporobacter ferrooxydans TaxID=2901836 RepID=A0ABY4CNK2_9BACL|nr:helix-turn-helix transcriptional regulator [Alicyclobacillaceae bacterium MYW30-H2]